ncbi:hypothetical protein [Limosilactobacillus fastidiosus]|uniref:Uncharacterized protein n=1 Tax=Limosilactobacillus fastidiosus TaxID=2759855 RepID=A0ABR6E5Z7_9LACO|nr:hypothetical protein [Limosilactobacillus fastidiosus]MBB1062620.1 hypothetical protein [Limosilactobacillus fastidiosus]MCD7083977.1 hypothetical protein [Limosilactobacillus fastidiosus]
MPNQLKYDLSGIKAGSVVKLPVLFYKNDMIKVGTEKFKKPQVTNVDTIQIRVPKRNKQVVINYHNSILDICSLVVSLLTWLCVLFIYIRDLIRKRGKYDLILKTR